MMEIRLADDYLNLAGKDYVLSEVIDTLANLSAAQIVAYFSDLKIMLPRVINAAALRGALNEKVKIAKTLNLSDEMMYRLRFYPDFSEYQLQSFFQMVHQPEMDIIYKKSLFKLLLMNATLLGLNDDNFLAMLELAPEPYEEFGKFEETILPLFYDFNKDFDAIRRTTLVVSLQKSATAVDIRDMGKKYGISIPKRLKRDEMQALIEEGLRKQHKLTEEMKAKLDKLPIINLQRLAKQNDIKVSVDLKKEDLIAYLLNEVDKAKFETKPRLKYELDLGDGFEFDLAYVMEVEEIEEFVNEQASENGEEVVKVTEEVVEVKEEPVATPEPEPIQEVVEEEVVEIKPEPIKLSAPNIVLIDKLVSWEGVENAASYKVIINKNMEIKVDATNYDLSTLAPGKYDIEVIALSCNDLYLDSDLSNLITYEVSEPIVEETPKEVVKEVVKESSFDWDKFTKCLVDVIHELTPILTAPKPSNSPVVNVYNNPEVPKEEEKEEKVEPMLLKRYNYHNFDEQVSPNYNPTVAKTMALADVQNYIENNYGKPQVIVVPAKEEEKVVAKAEDDKNEAKSNTAIVAPILMTPQVEPAEKVEEEKPAEEVVEVNENKEELVEAKPKKKKLTHKDHIENMKAAYARKKAKKAGLLVEDDEIPSENDKSLANNDSNTASTRYVIPAQIMPNNSVDGIPANIVIMTDGGSTIVPTNYNEDNYSKKNEKQSIKEEKKAQKKQAVIDRKNQAQNIAKLNKSLAAGISYGIDDKFFDQTMRIKEYKLAHQNMQVQKSEHRSRNVGSIIKGILIAIVILVIAWIVLGCLEAFNVINWSDSNNSFLNFCYEIIKPIENLVIKIKTSAGL